MHRRGLRILRSRDWKVLLCFLFVGMLLLLRLAYVQIADHTRYEEMGRYQAEYVQQLYSPRGSIYDRQGKPLAFSMMVKSLYVDPKHLKAKPEDAAKWLAPVLHMDEKALAEKMSRDTSFVWLDRLMDPDVSDAAQAVIREHQLEGIAFVEESKRYYPNGGLLANVLGFVGIDGKGLDGLEKSLEELIRGKVNRQLLLQDVRGNPILHSASAPYIGKEGKAVYLTIDESIQFFAERALDRAMGETRAKGGIVVMMDVKTGGILAMVSRPSYDPNHFSRGTENEFKNRAVVDIFEPGSTFKPIIAATALDAKTYTTDTVWHDPGAVWASGHAIRNWDDESYGDVRMVDILKFSINTGFAHVGLSTGGGILTDYAKKFGFGKPTGIELPGEGEGLLFNPDDMRPIDVATMSIGQSIAVTPLQMVQAYSAIANGGKMVRPHLISSIVNPDGSIYQETKTEIAGQPVSETVADTVKDMMEKEVSEGGGGKARVPGYHMGGKTGTAQKIDPIHGGYLKGQYIASFCGFGPTEDPQVICLVVLDDPQGMYYGGMVAAPVFAEIMGQTMRYLGIHAIEEPNLHTLPPAPAVKKAAEPTTQAEWITLPNFHGWSIRDTGDWLGTAGLHFRPDGSGKADSQSPAPGTTVRRGSDVAVHFSP